MNELNKERREIADYLRVLASHSAADEDYMKDALGLYRGNNVEGYDACNIKHLADLIDRPTTTRTCKNPGSNFEKYPCDICGYSVKDARWNYCPKCGAEIIDEY